MNGTRAGRAGRRLAGAVLAVCLVLPMIEGAVTAQTDPTVTITAGTATATEGETASFVVTRTGATTAALTVELDFDNSFRRLTRSPRPESVEIPIGAASATVDYTLLNNPHVESASKPLTLTVGSGTGYTVGDPASATVSVTNDGDQWITPTIGADQAVFENIGPQTVDLPMRLRTTGTKRDTAPDPWSFAISTRAGSVNINSNLGPVDYGAISETVNVDPEDWSEVDGQWEIEFDWAAMSIRRPTVNDDDEPEPPETFRYLIERTPAYRFDELLTVSPESLNHEVTIYDDDIKFVVDVAGDVSAVEGEEITLQLTAESKWLHACRTTGNQNNIADMELPLTLSLKPGTAEATSDITWSDGTTAPQTVTLDDFSAIEGSSTGACRVRATAEVDITTVEDTTWEEDAETFTVGFSTTDADAELPSADFASQIVDDDAPTLTVADARAVEGSDNLTFTVTLSPAQSGTVTVDYATADGTATVGDDYTALDGSLTFVANETSKTVIVDVLDDTTDEDDETVTLTLTNPDPDGVVIVGSGTGTIVDDDGPPRLSVADTAAPEGDGRLTFTVTLRPAQDNTVTVDYATADGTATAGDDYTETSGTLTFVANETSKTVTVDVSDDAVDERDETLTLTLTNPTNADIATATGTGTIGNDDEARLTIAGDVNALENGGNLTFEVTLDPVSDRRVTVDYATADGTATAGDDYTETSGTLTFAPGAASQRISVPISDDSLGEYDETLTLTLTNPTNADIATATRTGTITNDDAPSVYIADATASEAYIDRQPSVYFELELIPRATTAGVRLTVSTSGGTATAGVDYEARTGGVIRFAPGDSQERYGVPIIIDNVDEPDETFLLTITDISGASIGRGTATGTIIDDDGSARLYVTGSDAAEDREDLVFTVRLSPTVSSDVTVDYATSDGTATAGEDYTATNGTLTFAADTQEQTVTVPVLADTRGESDETVILTLTNASGAAIDGEGRATGTIIDDDGGPPRRLTGRSTTGPAGGTTGPAAGQGGAVPEVVPAPTITSLLNYVVLHIGGAPTTVDITSVFSGTGATYGAQVADEDIVTAATDGSVLSLTGLEEGTTTVTIHATNTNGAALQVFTAIVRARGAPGIATFLGDITVTVGDEPTMIDLAAAFDGTVDSYGAASPDSDILTVTVEGSQLWLTPIAAGVVDVTVTASTFWGIALQTMRVTVVDQGS